MHVSRTNLIFFTFKDGRLDIWRCTHSYTKPAFHTGIHLAKCGWSLLGGHMLCKDPDYPADACCAVPLCHSWEMGRGWKFNPEQMAESDYSHSTSYIGHFESKCPGYSPRECGHWVDHPQHKAPIGQISTIPLLIKYARSLLEVEGQSSEPEHRTFCTIVGNYGRHMAFATDPPFCMAYPLEFILKKDPAQMTFRNQQNHPVSCTTDGLLVHMLLMWDCPECEYTLATCNGCLLIPRGVQFPTRSFPRDSHPV